MLRAEVDRALDGVDAGIEPLSDEQLARQHSPIMSPIVWDLGHIANYEEQWSIRAHDPTSVVDVDRDVQRFERAVRHRPPGPTLPADVRVAPLKPARQPAFAEEVEPHLDHFGSILVPEQEGQLPDASS